MKKSKKFVQMLVMNIAISFFFMSTPAASADDLQEDADIYCNDSDFIFERYNPYNTRPTYFTALSMAKKTSMIALMEYLKRVLDASEKLKSYEELQEFASYIVDSLNEFRALRPDAPFSTNGAPVGTLLTVNNEQIVQLITKLFLFLKQCCSQIQEDFSGTFTVLTTLVQDFNGTFTDLASLENTLEMDFGGVFTVLAACCQADARDFSGIFTALYDLNVTITTDTDSTFTILNACCQNFEQDFSGVFTTLHEINNALITDFNGVFTALNEFCQNSIVEFNGIFTVLNEVTSTLTNDFNGTVTVLTSCCEALSTDFEAVFTALEDFNNTATIDFGVTFTLITQLIQDFKPIFTSLADFQEIIAVEFNGIFTALDSYCQLNVTDMSGVFTALTELSQTLTTSFLGTATLLNDCCELAQVEFNGIFTTLNDITHIITVNFNGTFTSLSLLIYEIESTFTVLNDISFTLSADLSGVFTALNDCCQESFNDFSSTFTLLADFNQILTADFNGIFTALAACCQTTASDISGIYTTLSDITNTVTVDFSGTFTVLSQLLSSQCHAVPITTPTTISASGFYCLANDIFSTIVITTSNVTIDLNNHTIYAPGQVGVSINNAQSNVMIANGRIDSTTVGVDIVNTDTVNLINLVITSCSDSGIVLNPFCTTAVIQDTIINSAVNYGINFVNNNNLSQCQRVTIINCNGPFAIGTSGTLSTALFEDCSVLDCTSTQNQHVSFRVSSGINNQIRRCSVKNIQNTVGAVTGFFIGSDVTTLDSCKVQGLIATTTAQGYAINDTGAFINNCLALGIDADESYGFNLTVTSAVMEGCLTQQISSVLPDNAVGFLVTGSGFSLTDCYAYQTTGTGIVLSFLSPGSLSTDGMLFNCGANNNSGDGFAYISFPFTYIADCTAFNNGLFGFVAEFVGAGQYGCFASGNAGGNYSSYVPNVQSASQNTGVFARGNNYL